MSCEIEQFELWKWSFTGEGLVTNDRRGQYCRLVKLGYIVQISRGEYNTPVYNLVCCMRYVLSNCTAGDIVHNGTKMKS